MAGTFSLLAAIERAASVAELSRAAAGLAALQRRLLAVGVDGVHQGLVITGAVDALTRRLIALAEAELGPPPAPYAWLACGSQGRGEQNLHTDQDNALIHADRLPADGDAWFLALSRRVTAGLDACGIPHCPGGVGPDHRDWRGSVSAWQAAFSGVVRTPETRAVMLASHYFDLRTIHGDAGLLDGVRRTALGEAAASRLFLARVRQNALRARAGVGWLRRWRTGRDGTVDLKHQGLLPIAQLALACALEGEIDARDTRTRLADAAARGLLTPAAARDLERAYNTVAELRNRTVIACRDAGRPASNRVAPATLARLEREHLRAALARVRDAQRALGQGVT